MADDCTSKIEAFLDRHRIETYRFQKRARHGAVVVDYLGNQITVIFPTSGCDWRAPRNAVSTLRHALGFVGKAMP
jgi:hypothetical protein